MIDSRDKTFTHYSYMSCPISTPREPTGLFNLGHTSVVTRRRLVSRLMTNGELLAVLPIPEIKNMKELRGYLKWEHDNK